MVTLIIVTLGILGTYGLMQRGQYLALTTENRIQATNFAREGMEVVENLRDSNWIKFSSDYANCWKVKDYNGACIGDTAGTNFFADGCYRAINTGGQWYLDLISTTATPAPTYTLAGSPYRIYLTGSGLTVQSGSIVAPACTRDSPRTCNTIFTREICLTNPDHDHLVVTTSVKWGDPSTTTFSDVVLSSTLTNWIRHW